MLNPMIGGIVGALLYFPPVIAQVEVQQFSPQVLSQTFFTPKGADEAISPLEIQQFAQALKQLKKVEMDTQQKMIEVLKEENLSPQRFQEIGQQQSNPGSSTTEVTPAEQERFDKALARMQTIQEESIPKQRQAITLQGLTVERFRQIEQAVNKSPALRQQLQNTF